MQPSPALKAKCENALDFAAVQVRNLIDNHPDFLPMYTLQGRWKHDGPAWTNWCEGFVAGQMWILHRHAGTDYWRQQAVRYSRLLAGREHDRAVHDLGFTFWSSWKRWHDLTGEAGLKDVIVTAGQTMGLRFQDKGRYLRSFIAAESLFIDIMMNVGIIFYAARETGDDALWNKALQHCLTSRRYLVRGDGSTSHEGIFDTETGAFLKQTTHQGWRDDSSWARGLGWSLYGFGTAYAYTQDQRFLQCAEMNAQYYMEHTPAHGVPPNDWREPDPDEPYESSAAAIAAGGFFNLARLTDDDARAQRYFDYACTILDSLTEPEFLAADTPGWEGILKRGMYHQRLGLGVNESVMWGEYFYLEALAKALGYE